MIVINLKDDNMPNIQDHLSLGRTITAELKIAQNHF